jgi:cytoskeletal protein CcmA (bactofilin family)
MWRSKQAPTATPAFSPSFVPTTTIEPEENVETNHHASVDSHVIPAGMTESIATGTMLGTMSGNDDMSLDGPMEGPISLKCHRLTVGRRAKATAEVVADEVIVYGELRGKLCAGKRIEIKKDASVMGMLTTPRIVIEDGAYFKGSVQIERRKKPRGTPQQHM